MESFWQDLRYGIRMLLKNPGSTAIAVLTLSLGIGANTAIFSLLDQMLLRLLPVRNPQELVLLTAQGDHYGNNWGGNALSYPIYQDFRDNEILGDQIFGGLLCRFTIPVSLSFEGHTERAAGELVSGNYFQVLRVGAALGRTLTPDDDRTPGGHRLVVLSYNYWKTRFASDRAIVDKTVIINGLDMTVLGVSERGFDGVELGFSPQVFIPVVMQAQVMPMPPGLELLKDRRSRWVNVFGRLRPGVTAARAKAALGPVFRHILETEVKEAAFRNASTYTRAQFLKMTMDVLPGSKGRSSLRQQVERPLWILMAMVGVVLLIACVNVANLLIARAIARQKEIAVRLALGASRIRLIRQLLAESLLLSLLGGAAGLLLAVWTNRLLLGFLPQEDSSLNITSILDVRILIFALAVSLLTGILFGLVPALRSTRPDLVPTLKDQAGAAAGGAGQVGLRKILVVAQVSLSLLLLVAAGLFVRSLHNLKALGPGFPTENLIGFNLDPSLNGYSPERCKLFYQQLTSNLNALPGVQSAALASVRILENNEWDSTVTVEGYEPKPGENMNPYFNSVSPGYFLTMGIPLQAGRDFTVQDTGTISHGEGPLSEVPKVVVINEKLARHYFGNRNAIGRHIGFGGDPGTKADMEIIGVIKDAKYTNLRDEIPRQVFVPYLAFRFVGAMTGYVRTTLEPDAVFATIRAEVKKLDTNLPIYAMRTLETHIDRSLLNERLVASLSTAFGFLAALLSTIGLYGVMAYTVALRTREIGIRMSLGARSSDVLKLVVGQGLRLVLIGLAIGLATAFALTRVLASFLFGVTATDPTTFAGVALLLSAVALLACYIPARRATKVNPMVALRYE
jgi:predicted permease